MSRPGGDNKEMNSAPRRYRPVVVALAVVAGLAMGVGATVVLTRDDTVELPSAPSLESSDLAPVNPDAPPGAAAESPEAAVEGFLRAEAADDAEASFGFLSAGDRAELATPAHWAARRSDLVPPVVDFAVEGVDEDEVVTLVRFEPGLDQIRGLVSEQARVTWTTSADGGSWGVILAASTIEALYPSDESAPDAVRQWAEGHRRCESPRTWEGTLQGSPALAEALCGLDGEVAVGPPEELGSVDAPVFLSAFGPRVGEWARVVAVTAPVSLRVVVAPIGQEWLVIGVLPG